MNRNFKNDKIHKILMLLCCLLPILIIGTLYFGKFQEANWSKILIYIAIFICPLSHIILMPLMMNNKESDKEQNGEQHKPSCH